MQENSCKAAVLCGEKQTQICLLAYQNIIAMWKPGKLHKGGLDFTACTKQEESLLH
jgi:hypothetical protein